VASRSPRVKFDRSAVTASAATSRIRAMRTESIEEPGPPDGLAEAGGGGAPALGGLPAVGKEIGFVGVGRGGAGGGDDGLQFVEGAGAAEGVFELADGVVDLGAGSLNSSSTGSEMPAICQPPWRAVARRRRAGG
jgi:hypothetical protein